MVTCLATWGWYGDGPHQRTVEDGDAAVALCREVLASTRERWAAIVSLTTISGAYFGIGLAPTAAVVTYWADPDGPYWQSVGSASPTNVDYEVDGHHSEFPADAHVPLDGALGAMREFIESGARPTAVELVES
jgi:hypothetical protein